MTRTAGSTGERSTFNDLTVGPIGPTLIAFALPTLGSSVLQSLSGSINAMLVGRFLGEDALAATTNGNIVMFMLIAFVFGFGMAATILISRAFGRKDVLAARRVTGTAIGTIGSLSIILAAVGWAFAPNILEVLGTPSEAQQLALDYLRVIFVSLPSGLMLTMLMMVLRGGGDSMTPLWFIGLSVLVGSGLNPVLILGLGPAPRMGIAGSAAATAIANNVSLAALVAFIYARDLPLRLRGPEIRFLVPDRTLLVPIFRKGVPMGLQMIVISSSALAMLGMVNREGLHTAAAYGATQQLWTYVQMPAMALGAAVSTMAAQNIGAGEWDRVSAITRLGVWFSVLLTGALIGLLALLDRYALGLFLGHESLAMPIARHIQLVATWGFLFFGICLVLFGTVRANGQVMWPLIILFVSMYPVRLGFAAGSYRWLGPDALWLSFPLSMVVTCIMATALYLQGGWRRGGLTAADPPDEQERWEQTQATREPGGALNPVV